DSPWFMVARMDISEAYAPLTQVLWMVIALVGALLIGAGSAVGLVGRQQSNRFYKARAETAELLLESEQKYRNLIAQSPDGIFIVNLNGIFLAVNRIMCEKLQYSEAEMLSMSIWDIVPEQFVEQHKKRMADILTGKAPNEAAEYTVRGKDGTLYYVEILSAPYYEGKELIGFQAIARDITDRKLAQEALEEREKFLDNVIEHTPNPLWISDAKGTVIRINQALKDLLKITAEEIVGKYNVLQDIQVKEQGFLPLVQSVFEEGKTVRFNLDYDTGKEAQVELQQTTHRIIDIVMSAVKNKDGKVTNAICLEKDVTERLLAQKALRQEEERFRTLFTNTPIGIAIADNERRFIDVNEAFCSMLGYTRSELLTMTVADVVAPDEREQSIIMTRNLMSGKTQGYATERRYTKKDGSVILTNVTAAVGAYHEGHPLYGFGIVQDITEQRQAEESILRSKMLLQNVIDSTPDWMYVKDQQHRYLMVNRSFAESQNVSPQEMIGKPDLDFFAEELCMGNPEKGITGFHADDDRAFQGRIVRNTRNIVSWADGSLHIYNTYKIPLHDQFGSIYGVLVYSRDMTEWQKAQDDREAAFKSLQKTLHDMINAMARIVEMRDPYTAGHQKRVAELAGAIAREINLDDSSIDNIIMAATIHDIGKINVPADILGKPGKLSDIEWEMIKIHPQGSYDIVKDIEFPPSVALMVLQHHERVDGSGYPGGLKGDEILPEAKILAVADVVEAIASHRPYRPSRGIDESLEEISSKRGKLYDPVIVDACLKLFKEKGFHFED
ncbi:MAG: PAS domain S-box protein, partial [Dehalococcoidia bacterium]|nr:PAS domain S-box protein [Dehalococcoidia bacterium]